MEEGELTEEPKSQPKPRRSSRGRGQQSLQRDLEYSIEDEEKEEEVVPRPKRLLKRPPKKDGKDAKESRKERFGTE